MRHPMPPATPEDTSSDQNLRNDANNQCRVKASIINIPNTDDEIIRVLAPEIEKFGMIKMTIKIATDDNGKQYRWVVIEFDDTHDFNDFRHYISNQKGSISIFGNILNFKFYSGKQDQRRENVRPQRKRKLNNYEKVKKSNASTKSKVDAGEEEEWGSEKPIDNIDKSNDQSTKYNAKMGVEEEEEWGREDDGNVDHNANNQTLKYNEKDSKHNTSADYSPHDTRTVDNTHRKQSEYITVDDADNSGYTADSNDGNKFRNYQRYDDRTPTRTLYFGNLDKNIETSKVRRIFSNHGQILDLVVKRQGRFAAYGFVKFLHLKDALGAKNRLKGTYVAKHRMAVGFGSICQTSMIWVGDYSRQIDADEICCEVKKYADYLDYLLGDDQTHIYFVFKNIQDALRALKNLRGLRLNGHRHPVQVDFADPRFEACYLYEQHHKLDSTMNHGSTNEETEHATASTNFIWDTSKNVKTPETPPKNTFDNHSLRASTKNSDFTNSKASYKNRRETTVDNETTSDKPQRKSKLNDIRDNRSHNKNRIDNNDRKVVGKPRNGDLSPKPREKLNDPSIAVSAEPPVIAAPISNSISTTSTISTNIATPFPVVWKGYMSVKSQNYGTKLHFLAGNNVLVSNSLKCSSSSVPNGTFGSVPCFSFQKRYPLNEDNVEDFKSNLASAVLCNDYCAFIGLPCSINATKSSSSYVPSSGNTSNLQQSQFPEKPLKEFIQYLNEKNTAVHITDFDPINQLSLYVFPPCDFSREFIASTLPADNRMVLSLAATSHVLAFVIK